MPRSFAQRLRVRAGACGTPWQLVREKCIVVQQAHCPKLRLSGFFGQRKCRQKNPGLKSPENLRDIAGAGVASEDDSARRHWRVAIVYIVLCRDTSRRGRRCHHIKLASFVVHYAAARSDQHFVEVVDARQQ